MFVGIDIGGTQIKSALLDQEGQIRKRGLVDTPTEKAAILAVLFQIVKEFQEGAAIQGIGVSAPGVIREDGLMLTAGAVMSLYGSNLKQALEEEFGLPVFVENDGKAAAIAEKWLGNAQDVSDYLCIVLGTGVGGGIVINGQVLRGGLGAAGEFSWMVSQAQSQLDQFDHYLVGQMGVVAGLCSSYNAKEQAENPDFSPTRSAKAIFEQEEYNPIAREAIASYIRDVAVGLFNFTAIFNPEKILLGGGISANPVFIQRVKDELEEVMSQHLMIAEVKEQLMPEVQVAGLKNDAGLLGAVYQLQQRMGR